MNTTVQITLLSKDRSAVHRYLTVTDITYMGFMSGTEGLDLGNFEASLDSKSSMLFIRQ